MRPRNDQAAHQGALAIEPEVCTGDSITASEAAAPHSPVSNTDQISAISGGDVDHDENVETEFVKISGFMIPKSKVCTQDSIPDSTQDSLGGYEHDRCGIFFHQPRHSLSEVLLSKTPRRCPKFVQPEHLDAYLYDSSGLPALPHHDHPRPCETAARLLHDFWHENCSDFVEFRSNPYCQPKQAPPWLVEPSLFQECDIGLACAAIRGWHEFSSPPPLSLFNLRLKAGDWAAYRTAHITPTNTIRDPYTVFPRRLWDLETNRVVPAWLCYRMDSRDPLMTREGAGPPMFAAISHSWQPPSELVYVETPINAFAWPVPLPAGLDLETLRKQIQAKTDYRYVWLDVLCLRQAHNVPAAAAPTDQHAQRRRHGTEDSNSWIPALSLARDSDGSLRSSELAIDVPTIGNVYRLASQTLRYLNGLGQPLSLTGWDLPTHWRNRAWTLQEHVPRSVDLGIEHIPGNYRNLHVARSGVIRRVRDHLQAVALYDHVAGSPTSTLLELVAEMGRRFATNEVDKVAGLSYALQLPELPTYAGAAGVEAAWRRSLAILPPRWLAELFFNCPLVPVQVDDGGWGQWTPTWEALAGLPPSFVPYAIMPRDGDGSVVQANGPGSMRVKVACIFPTSITPVEGTGADYVLEMLSANMETLDVFVAHDGLPKIDLRPAMSTGSMFLMARLKGEYRVRAPDWVETWVLLLLVEKTRNWTGSRVWSVRKLGVFRTDTEMSRSMETDAYLTAYVDGDIVLQAAEVGFDMQMMNWKFDFSAEDDDFLGLALFRGVDGLNDSLRKSLC